MVVVIGSGALPWGGGAPKGQVLAGKRTENRIRDTKWRQEGVKGNPGQVHGVS